MGASKIQVDHSYYGMRIEKRTQAFE